MNAAAQKEAWREVYMALNEAQRMQGTLNSLETALKKLDDLLADKPRKPRTKKSTPKSVETQLPNI